MANGNFILKVDNVSMPCPTAYEWQLSDVSAGESGRTDDALMHKNRVGQKRKLLLSWSNTDPDTTALLLNAFDPEYFSVYYWDAKDNQYETRTFYAGDRTAPLRIWFSNNKRFETVSFDIIER